MTPRKPRTRRIVLPADAADAFAAFANETGIIRGKLFARMLRLAAAHRDELTAPEPRK